MTTSKKTRAQQTLDKLKELNMVKKLERDIPVFVYGSLRAGLGNSFLLNNAKYIDDFVTEKHYLMADLGSYPAVVKPTIPYAGGAMTMELNETAFTPSQKAAFRRYYRPILGELYMIHAQEAAALDDLEGHPYWYRRELVNLRNTNPKLNQEAWMYIMPASMLFYKNDIALQNESSHYDWTYTVQNKRRKVSYP